MKRLNHLLTPPGVLLIIGLMSTPVLAKGVPANMGRPVFAADASCFMMVNGAVKNVCSTARHYTVPMEIDDFRATNRALVTALSANASSVVSCTLCAVNLQGTSIQCSNWINTPQNGVDVSYEITTGNLWGTLYLTCNIPPGSWLDSVHWQY